MRNTLRKTCNEEVKPVMRKLKYVEGILNFFMCIDTDDFFIKVLECLVVISASKVKTCVNAYTFLIAFN